MHCHLRLAIPLVVFSFNHQPTTSKHNQTMHGCVIDHSRNFPRFQVEIS